MARDPRPTKPRGPYDNLREATGYLVPSRNALTGRLLYPVLDAVEETGKTMGSAAAQLWNLPNELIGTTLGQTGQMVGRLTGGKPSVERDRERGMTNYVNSPLTPAGIFHRILRAA